MKRIIGIVTGVACGFVIVFCGDAITHALHPVPYGFNYADSSAMQHYISGIPRYIFLLMTFFWLLSAFCGGLVSALITKTEWKRSSLTTGAILLAAALLNLVMTTPAHPLWMWLAALAGYIPAAFLGGWMAGKKYTNTKQV